jgi:hypothetical protein
MPALWSRRELLCQGAAASLAVAATAAGCARRDGDGGEISAASRSALWNAGIVPEGNAAIQLGRRYRHRHPDQHSIGDLCRALGGDPLPVEPGQWRRAAERALRGDLEAGRSIELDGWVVTLTEARLLGLASFGPAD